jgi:hypothetical protein
MVIAKSEIYPNVDVTRTWVNPYGLAVCEQCAADHVFRTLNQWDIRWNVPNVLTRNDFEQVPHEFCSECDRD